ncbi:MAG: PQQ-binding-like beta-propeller repeat protein [Gemmatimonadetes bacterium]|nr:PQQ-binding-like beta-propeller repeat protein [Gemmatimonadota bacterium]
MHILVRSLLLAGALPVLASPLAAQRGTNGSWPFYAGDAGSTRYSALSLIDARNVGTLQTAWRWSSTALGGEPEYNSRVTPLFVDGVLYATAGWDRTVVALDAGTGALLWRYTHDEGERAGSAPRRNSGRGVAWWADGDDRRVLLVTPAFFLVALDARTGQPVPGFGTGGVVDLREGLGREVDAVHERIGSSSPPIVVGDVVVVGSAHPGGGAPDRPDQAPGPVRGYDVRTGALRWTFHTLPRPGEAGYDTWAEGTAERTGNTAAWAPLTADPELGYVYLPVEASTGDYYGGHRPGDNLFSQSLVCLDARTGERVWHFQTVHHGIWDYDPPAAPILADLTVDGQPVRAVVQLTKQGFAFVFDRVSGAPVWPIEERAVPQSDVPGEVTSPTQPFPTRPAPFDRQGVTEDDLLDLTPALKQEALALARQFRMGPLFTPPSLREEGGTQGTLTLPGSLGGANWPGGALDVATGILYVSSATSPSVLALGTSDASTMRYVSVRSGVRLERGGGPQGLPLIKPPWGRITAIDLNTGEHVWMRPNGEAPAYVRDHPALAGREIGYWGRPDRGGLLVTATLLLAGEGGGMYAGYGSGGTRLRAHDKATGRTLAELELPARQSGVPMTYLHEGRQYVLVTVGAPDHPAELVALTLPAGPERP